MITIFYCRVLLILLGFRLFQLDSGCYPGMKVKKDDVEAQESDSNSVLISEIVDSIPSRSEKSSAELYKEVKSSVYFVLTGHDDEIAQGTAFTVDRYGLAVSNYHVFEDANEALILDENGNEYNVTEVLEENSEMDYIIFRIGNKSSFPFLPITQDLPQIGDDCFTVGNPHGLMQTFSKGYVSNYWKDYIQTTTEITHGSSGGPLFDLQGRVIGVTTSTYGEGNLNFALMINRVPLYRYSNRIPKPPLQEPTVYAIESEKDNHTSREVDLEEKVNNYYLSTTNEEWNDVKTFYSPRIKRFYTASNLVSDDAITLLQKKNQEQSIIKYTTSIRSGSLNLRDLSNGNVAIDFIADIFITRTGDGDPSKFAIKTSFEFDSSGKIVSIYEKGLVTE
jgi:serine protease Do